MTLQLAFWLFGIAFLLFALRWLFPGVSINSTGEVLAVATLVTIGGLIVLSLRLHYRDFFRNVAIWSGIVLVLAIAYAFRHEIGMVADRVAGVATSERGYSAGDAWCLSVIGTAIFWSVPIFQVEKSPFWSIPGQAMWCYRQRMRKSWASIRAGNSFLNGITRPMGW
ncbi:hypothetical protein JCM17845_18440 [Iodidimonas gelatinilytica]|uniref:Uncharacterized protein n=1 Tax=Iodidimonas gelatinilytica TaxID=1236966 RepID=A0A5A7MYQ9_9PROT|nr:hypothetical protein JCM17845_18440 [Iodidimonas gelatinilytica]